MLGRLYPGRPTAEANGLANSPIRWVKRPNIDGIGSSNQPHALFIMERRAANKSRWIKQLMHPFPPTLICRPAITRGTSAVCFCRVDLKSYD